MTFKDLSNIIRKRKEHPLTSAIDQEKQQEIAEAQAAIGTLRTNHLKSYQERETKWKAEHPGKKFYERSEEDNRRDCTIEEWFWNFFERAHASESAEVRYQFERNPDHGFGHVPYPIGIHEWDVNKCAPGCRFYEPTGRLTAFDILEDYRGYQKFDDVWLAYKELKAEGQGVPGGQSITKRSQP
jgi:hypothetical protein